DGHRGRLRRAAGQGRGRRRRDLAHGRPGAADVLAPGSGQELAADRRGPLVGARRRGPRRAPPPSGYRGPAFAARLAGAAPLARSGRFATRGRRRAGNGEPCSDGAAPSAENAVSVVPGKRTPFSTIRSASVVQARYHASKPSRSACPAPNGWSTTAGRPGRFAFALIS